MPDYQAAYPVGSHVRVVDRHTLERFRNDWKYHHRLEGEQLNYAGEVATVEQVTYYHGGAPLYQLLSIPGIWHEECLEGAAGKNR